MAYFNYRNLDPTDFEALAKDVMERLLGCELCRYGQGKDGGIDLCDNIREKNIVVQCKKYQAGSFDQLYRVFKNEEKPKIDKLNPRPGRYYVFTSLELLPRQKQKLFDLFQEYMESESYIIDGIAISDFFRDKHNHDLISRNIKLFLSFPDNYTYSPADLSQIKENRLYDHLQVIFENDKNHHPSIRMMDPDPLLFPKGLPEILSDGRYAVEDKEDPRAIRDMILDSWKRDDRRHILLIGEGGIGKTVAMLTLPKEDWFQELGIPAIYVPLQSLDKYEGDLNRYLEVKFGANIYNRIIELANSFPDGHPRLLLLLDGFNEVPDKYKQNAGKHIRDWMMRPGIQIITTSRLGFSLENSYSKYRLQPLPYDTVRSFLLSSGIKEESLPGESDRISKVINVPLMLAIYTQIERVKDEADRSSAARILEWKEPDNAAHIIWDYLQIELYRSIERNDSSHSVMKNAIAILTVAPYVCCQMSQQIKFYIKQGEFIKLIREALTYFASRKNRLSSQILNVREEFDPYHNEAGLFQESKAAEYARILIDNTALFQKPITRVSEGENKTVIDHICSLMHQNFRDALAAFFICSCLPKTSEIKEKKALLDYSDYYVKNYIAEHLSGQELLSIWDKHRKEEPEDGQITFILLDLIGRQRDYDYRKLDFSGIDLTKTNLHSLLSRRMDICPLSPEKENFERTKVSLECLFPNGHAGGVNSVAYSPDGRHLASGADDRTVRVWNLENGECRVLQGHAGRVSSVAYSPDGRHLASGASDSTVRVWDLVSGESRILQGHEGFVRCVAYSPDGRFLASGADDRTVRIWDLVSGESRVLQGHEGQVYSIAYNPYHQMSLASGASDGTVWIWDLVSGESRVLQGHEGFVRSIAYSPDGKSLAIGTDDSAVRIWDLVSGESRVLQGHKSWVSSVRYSPDGRYLASGADDSTVRIWDLENGENRVLQHHVGEISSIAYSPDGRHLASSADNRTVRIWDLVSGESRVLQSYEGGVSSIAYSLDGRHLAIGADDRTIRIWNLVSGDSRVLQGHLGKISSVDYSPDGKHLASGASDRTVRIWDLESGESYVLQGHADWVRSVAYSPDGRFLASGASDKTVRIWDLKTGKSRVLQGHAGWVNSVAYSPDGKYLATGASDRTVRIWDIVSGKSRMLPSLGDWMVNSVKYSPDGRHLAIDSSDEKVRVWDLVGGRSQVLPSHAGWVRSIAYSPDRMHLAAGASDNTVRIWDLASMESRVLHGHEGWARSVVYSPSGMHLATGASDSTVRIWDVEDYKEVGIFVIVPHLNLCGANFELAIIDEKSKEILKAAGARV